MTKTSAALVGLALLGLMATAQAGNPLALNDQQMDIVTAGNAMAATTMQAAARGPHATLASMVGNTAVDLGPASLAQSRGGVLGTGRLVKADIYSVAGADPFQSSAGSNGLAMGQNATLSAFALSTAVSAAPVGASQAVSSLTGLSTGSSR
jgi:hypothetical protein